MANSRMIMLLVVVAVLSLLPAGVYGGGGGAPPAPTLGGKTTYCCVTLQGPGGQDVGRRLNGTGCTAIPDTPDDRNLCAGTTAKCKGELYTPTTGVVTNCTPD